MRYFPLSQIHWIQSLHDSPNENTKGIKTNGYVHYEKSVDEYVIIIIC